jgi:hypothetical protein
MASTILIVVEREATFPKRQTAGDGGTQSHRPSNVDRQRGYRRRRAMLTSISFTIDTYWTVWITMFPSVPFWSPHGAVITPIIFAALCVLAGKYSWDLLRRT